MEQLPDSMTSQSLKYLQQKSILQLPDICLQRELLRSYIAYLHGYMPILELDAFLECMFGECGPYERVSLLVFQALLFAGSAFINFHFKCRWVHMQEGG